MARITRNVHLGVTLPDAVKDFADLYERDEFQLFALGLRVNHRYGGNASELLDNLIRLIREREQGARQLKAMTGETRMTAVVLALLPVSMVAYFLAVNPAYLLHMWNDGSGQKMLLVAFAMQTLGCLALWRMLRSI
jgi:tight adherence protein B